MFTLRVAGLGHKLDLQISSAASLASLQAELEAQTHIPAGYQRLISHGKNVTKDVDSKTKSLSELGIQDRTKFMLMHNEHYAADKEGCEQIGKLQSELDALQAKYQAGDMNQVALHELTTQLCCKLDGIDIHGSQTLRAMRKKVLLQAEALDQTGGDE